MVDLLANGDPTMDFIKVIPSSIPNKEKLWNVYVGYHERASYFATKEPIVMSSQDVKHFAKVLKSTLRDEPDQEVELPLTFFENWPELKIFLKFMRPGDKYYTEYLKGKIRIGVTINSDRSATENAVEYHDLKAGEEFEYSINLVINGIIFFCVREYFTQEELLAFADTLEKTASH